MTLAAHNDRGNDARCDSRDYACGERGAFGGEKMLYQRDERYRCDRGYHGKGYDSGQTHDLGYPAVG